MKLSITSEQFSELASRDKIQWLAWANESGYGIVLSPSIGHMIDFLKGKQVYDEYKGEPYTFVEIFWSYLRNEWVVRFDSDDGGSCMEYEDTEELCDALWEAVKATFERR